MKGFSTSSLAVAAFATTLGFALAQEPSPTPAPTTTPAPTDETPSKDPVTSHGATSWKEGQPFRPIESNVIVNLPSVVVPPEGTLTFLVTHRFVTPLSEGTINNFFTLDLGNTWGFGLWYAPIENLNVGFYRTSDLATYEASAQYQLPSLGGFSSAIRFGADWRTSVFEFDGIKEPDAASPKSSLFAQAVLAYSFGKYVRITAVPTYLQRTNERFSDFFSPPPGDLSCRPNGNEPPAPQYRCSGLYENVFNVPVGISVALTHSITVHGEVYPRLSDVNSSGVGWSVTVEKSLLRHRFAFFAGNQRQTTVDQYTQAVLFRRDPNNVYIGFNLYRAWKLK
jgi:hypothetical protein